MTTEQNRPWAQDNHVFFFWNKIQLAQHLKFYDLIIPKASTHVTFGQQSSLPRQAVLAPFNKTQFIACVASVSMWFQSKEQGMRVNPSLFLSPSQKMALLPLFKWPKQKIPLPIIPLSFFAPKPLGNVGYSGYKIA